SDNLPAAERGFVEAALRNRMELAAILIAPGAMQEQILDGADLQSGQLRVAFRTHAEQTYHRPLQRREIGFKRVRSHRWDLTNHRCARQRKIAERVPDHSRRGRSVCVHENSGLNSRTF